MYRGGDKGLYVVARNFFLLLLTCSAWPCLGPAYQNKQTFISPLYNIRAALFMYHISHGMSRVVSLIWPVPILTCARPQQLNFSWIGPSLESLYNSLNRQQGRRARARPRFLPQNSVRLIHLYKSRHEPISLPIVFWYQCGIVVTAPYLPNQVLGNG